jgi:hypothetical protein
MEYHLFSAVSNWYLNTSTATLCVLRPSSPPRNWDRIVMWRQGTDLAPTVHQAVRTWTGLRWLKTGFLRGLIDDRWALGSHNTSLFLEQLIGLQVSTRTTVSGCLAVQLYGLRPFAYSDTSVDVSLCAWLTAVSDKHKWRGGCHCMQLCWKGNKTKSIRHSGSVRTNLKIDEPGRRATDSILQTVWDSVNK